MRPAALSSLLYPDLFAEGQSDRAKVSYAYSRYKNAENKMFLDMLNVAANSPTITFMSHAAWEAKKARALQRRYEQQRFQAQDFRAYANERTSTNGWSQSTIPRQEIKSMVRSLSGYRVSQPPGGRSSLAFGGGGESSSAQRPHSVSERECSMSLADRDNYRLTRRDSERRRRPVELDIQYPARIEREVAARNRQIEQDTLQQRRREETVTARSDALENFLDAHHRSTAPEYEQRQKPAIFGRQPSCEPGRISSNAWATGSNQNCGNFITDRPTSRVLNPPGGRSSFSLG